MVHRVVPENELQVDFVRLRNKTIDSVIFCYELFESVSQYCSLVTDAEMKPEPKRTLLEPRTKADLLYIDSSGCSVYIVVWPPPIASDKVGRVHSILLKKYLCFLFCSR